MHVEISGKNVTGIVAKNSLAINGSVGQRRTARFRLFDPSGTTHIQTGEPVEIRDADENVIFTGLVETPDEDTPQGTNAIEITVDCVDNAAKADRHLVARTYEDTPCGDIIRDILAGELAGEGISAGDIEDGPVVRSAVFPYIPASQVFDELAELSGLMWYVDTANELHFLPTNARQAPWNVTETAPARNIHVKTLKNKLRNRQFIRAGNDITDVLDEHFRGDGDRQTFTVGFGIARVPSVYVSYDGAPEVQETVGIRGVESGRDWYWSQTEKEITQERENTPLTNADTMRVSYRGFFPIIVVADDPASFEDRRNIEGGTGIYEHIESKASIDDRDAALDIARGKLRKYSTPQTRVTFETDEPGLRAGQRINVNLPRHDVAGDFLIERVNITQIRPNELRYFVTCTSGESEKDWTHFFKSIAQQGEDLTIRDNEILLLLETHAEQTGWTEEVATQAFACPVPSDDLFPDENLFPC